MKITLSSSQPKSHNKKTIFAIGAGITALAAYVATSDSTKEKIKDIAHDLKKQWDGLLESGKAEIEMDAGEVKAAAKKIIRKTKATVAKARSGKSRKQ